MKIPSTNQVSVFMFHAVHPKIILSNSNFMSTERFEEIVKYLLTNYDVIDIADLKELETTSTNNKRPICLLTFDDGLLDHFTYVLPILKKYWITAAFYPSSSTFLDGVILETHMSQFILALAENLDKLMSNTRNLIFEEVGTELGLQLIESINLKPDRFSIERTLDRDLPKFFRSKIVIKLFEQYVSSDRIDFGKEFYMNESHVLELIDSGMHVGSHLYSHEWVSTLNHSERLNEVDLSLGFLRRIGMKPDSGWTLAYPFGDFDNDFVNLVNSFGCTFAFGVKNQPSSLEGNVRLRMSRINADTFSI